MSPKSIDFDPISSVGLKKEDAEEIISVLSKYGAEKVLLFGSRVTGGGREDSDIDLAVVGMAEESFFRALGEILFRVSSDVDLIDLSKAKNTLRSRIEREGRVIYEK